MEPGHGRGHGSPVRCAPMWRSTRSLRAHPRRNRGSPPSNRLRSERAHRSVRRGQPWARAELYQWYLYCVAKIQAIDAGLNWYGYRRRLRAAVGDSTISTATARDLCNRALEAEQRVFSLLQMYETAATDEFLAESGGRTGSHAAGGGPGEGRATGREQYARPGPVPVHRPASRRPGQEERGAGGRGAGHHRGGGRRRRRGGHRRLRGSRPARRRRGRRGRRGTAGRIRGQRDRPRRGCGHPQSGAGGDQRGHRRTISPPWPWPSPSETSPRRRWRRPRSTSTSCCPRH